MVRTAEELRANLYSRLIGTEPNLAAYYRLDEGTGTTTADASGHGLAGTLFYSPTWSPRARPVFDQVTSWQPVSGTNLVLNLDGVDDHVRVPAGIWFGNEFTIETWVYERSYVNWSRVIDFGNGAGSDNVVLALCRETTGKPDLMVFPSGQNVTAPDPIPLNQWVHLAATLKNNFGTIYVNGVAVVSGPVTAPNAVTRNNNYIGRDNWGATTLANALFDDLRIWNVARTPAQLLRFMTEPVAPGEPNLVLNYRFDEPSGLTAVDSRTTSPQDGTLTNDASRLSSIPVSTTLSGLAPGTVYHVRSVAQNPKGTTVGSTERFATLPVSAQDNWGSALSFDGNGTNVAIADSSPLDMTANYTLECWFKPAVRDQWGGLVSKYQTSGADGYFLRFRDGNLEFDGLTTIDLNLQPGIWHHAAAVNNNGTRHLYVNGVEQTLNGSAITVKANGDPVCLGVDYGSRYFQGQMDEVCIWNVARSAVLIKADMLGPLTGTEAGLVACYHFDEGTGTAAADATGNRHTGNLVNAPTWLVSTVPIFTRWNWALPFDGNNDFVQIADSGQLDMTANYTLECWFNPAVRNQWGGLVDKYQTAGANGYFLLFRDGNLEFDGMTTSDLNLQPGVWYHAAGVNANGARRLYVNGLERTLSGSAVTVQANNDPVCLGVDYGSRYFQGQMDEVRIWNVARSAGQIRVGTLSPLAGTEAGLVACYHCDEGTGTTATDATGHGHTGIVNQPTWLVSTVPSLSLEIPALWLAIVDAAPGATITLTNTGTLALTGWEIPIEKDLTLVGPGAAKLAINGNNSSRVFNIASNVTVNLSGLTIRDGKSADGATGSPGGTGEHGGGIYNQGVLTLSDCVVTGNRTGNGGNGNGEQNGGDGGNGGGIFIASGGILTLNRCTISGNSTGSGGPGGRGGNGATGNPGGAGGNGANGGIGGGIYSYGILALNKCLLSENKTGSGGAGADGGDAGTDVLDGENGGNGGAGGSGGFGGGIYANGQLALTNCTISGNSVGSGANGGIGGTGTGGTAGSGSNGSSGNGGAGGGRWSNLQYEQPEPIQLHDCFQFLRSGGRCWRLAFGWHGWREWPRRGNPELRQCPVGADREHHRRAQHQTD